MVRKNKHVTRDHALAPGFMVFTSPGFIWKVFWFLSLLAVIGMMCLIFHFSSSPGKISSHLSRGISYDLLKLLHGIFPSWIPQKHLKALMRAVEKPIRKTAHFSEYTLLGLLVQTHIYSIRKMALMPEGRKLSFMKRLPGVLFCVLYAASDEIHQYFVPGRACRFTDVCIDSTGIIFGTFLFLMIVLPLLDGLFGKGYNEEEQSSITFESD